METTSEPVFSLKHRVTGALILLALPVLLLPWLLNGQGGQETVHEPAAFLEPKGEFNSSIGPSSESQTALAKSEPDVSDAPGDQISTENTETVASGQSEKSEDNGEDSDNGRNVAVASVAPTLSGVQQGWVVRVGVFSQAENLKKRSSLLKDNGMTPQQEHIEINGRAAVRIFLGPFSDLATAERESGKAMLVTGEPAFVVQLN
jgi:DedD protein